MDDPAAGREGHSSNRTDGPGGHSAGGGSRRGPFRPARASRSDLDASVRAGGREQRPKGSSGPRRLGWTLFPLTVSAN